MFKRILVAFDGSTHAKQALKDAAELVRLSGGELTVLSVAPPLSAWAFGGGIAAPLNVNEIKEGIEGTYREVSTRPSSLYPRECERRPSF
jgi:nucleotide-binding universal stress UspA family protein